MSLVENEPRKIGLNFILFGEDNIPSKDITQLRGPDWYGTTISTCSSGTSGQLLLASGPATPCKISCRPTAVALHNMIVEDNTLYHLDSTDVNCSLGFRV